MDGSENMLVVRQWRMVTAEPSGMLMWFDPELETPLLRSTHLDSDTGSTPSGENLEHSPERWVIPDEGSASEEVPEGVQHIKGLQLQLKLRR